MDEGAPKENNLLPTNDDNIFVDSLIAKGISFREAKTLRSA